jgi:hypothetical protein
MPPRRHTLGVRRQLDRDIKRLDNERARLMAARAALDGELLAPAEKPRRISQDDIAADLAEHPESTYTEVARRLETSPINVAAHLSRGQKSARFRNSDGKWSLEE